MARRGALPLESEPDDADVVDAEDAVPTTAIVAEVRDGVLYIYLPPTDEAEHFVDLIRRVEAAAIEDRLPGRARGLRASAGSANHLGERHP